MTDRLPDTGYRADIDGLRAIAILSVVAFHAFPARLGGGFIGVDVFFVISGFLISSHIINNLNQGDFSFKLFYIKRIKRIFPALLIILIACYLFGWFSLFTNEFRQLGKHIASGSGFISNFVLWNESGYFDKSSDLKPLLHLWSLSIEEQFYIFWPFFLFSFHKLRFNLLKMTLFLILLSFTYSIYQINYNSSAAFYSIATRFWELLIGTVLAQLTLSTPEFFSRMNERYTSVLKNISSLIGLTCIAYAAYFFKQDPTFPGWKALFPTVGAALLIAAGPKALLNRFLSNPLFVWIGLISYPLYLWHWPILSYMHIIESGEQLTTKNRLLAIVASMVLAWLTYLLIERPVRYNKRNERMTFMLCGLLACVGTLGLFSFISPPARTGTEIIRMENERKFADTSLLKQFNENCAHLQDSVGPCSLSNKKGRPTVAIVGDSHVTHFFFGLVDLYEAKGETLIMLEKGGCLPLFNMESQISGKAEDCYNSMNKYLNYALNEESIKTIIFTNRGALYITGEGFEEPELKMTLRLRSEPGNRNFSDIYEKAMRATMSRFAKSGKEIIFINVTPELGFNPELCNEPRPLSSNKRPMWPCIVSKQIFMSRNEKYLEIVKDVLASFPSIKTFDPSKFLCDDNSCHAILDGKVLYRDDDHLSLEGGLFLGRKFINEIYPP